MSKLRLRMVRLNDCMHGTRFWYAKGNWAWAPCTLITKRKDGQCVVHAGHEFNIRAGRWKTQGWRSVWVEKDAAIADR